MARENSSKLDKEDRQILNIIQRDCLRPVEQIAFETGLSASSVQRRVRRMRTEGVIERQVAVVDAKKLGFPLTFVAALEVERERKELLVRLKQWLEREEAIQQAIYVTGAADVILTVIAPDIEAYDELTQRLLEDNPNVRRLTTSVGLQVYKRGLFVPTGSP
ncbi:Lrp/AsnC family transcriptional regulator [Mesorhizobium sp. M1396]|uniref:Lrp/AsnC family transcriptional regulator n=1 Tax=Mesorhizobium sp. M1396 TaxID=2957095 RepID=UPI003339C80A